jgi:hypothetical protein
MVVEFPIPDKDNILMYNIKEITELVLLMDIDKEIRKKSIILEDFFLNKKKAQPIYQVLEWMKLKGCFSKVLKLDGLYSIKRQKIPIIKIPRSLKKKLKLNNKELLLKIVNNALNQNKLTEIIYKFINKMLITSDRFGCDFINGEWTILAKLSDTSLDSIHLAHELGHCVYNTFYKNNTIGDQIKSEASAYLFEYSFAKVILSNKDFLLWKRYVRAVDNCNLALMYFELSLVKLLNHNYLKRNDFIFHNKSLALRESLWTSHGYQLVYVAAAEIRNKIIKNII